MNKENKVFYITTPIYYPSASLHIGHTLTTTMADSIRRYKALKGYDTYFLTGSDEHGQKIEKIAKEKNVAPIEYTTEIVKTFKELWSNLDINYDKFIRTTDEYHMESVQKIFQTIYDKGDIYKGKYTGYYCTSCESFYTETQVEDSKCPDCGKEISMVEEESYFFKMSKYEQELLDYIENNPEFIKPETRRNEMISFIKSGLQDLCISRNTFDWGIPLTIDEDHVIYVWFDALTNYISALDYMNEGDLYQKFWVNNDEIVHIVGKDILRFHTIIWPCMLLSANIKLPKQVFGHSWLLIDGGKMSKSQGNVIDPNELIEKYGTDALRYYLLRELPYNSDVTYNEEALAKRINIDLANDYGNLLSRTVSMIEKYFSGEIIIPKSREEYLSKQQDLGDLFKETIKKYDENMESLHTNLALASVLDLVSYGNKLIENKKPWELQKNNETDELIDVIYTLVEIIRVSTTLLSPVMTKIVNGVKEQLGIKDDIYFSFEKLNLADLDKSYTVSKKEPLFPRIDLKEFEDSGLAKESNSDNKKNKKAENNKEDAANLITIDEFFKTELKVGKIVEAEKVMDADKLLKLKVSMGDHERSIVAGIAKYYEVDELIGKKVAVVTNLKPAKLRGILSEGMLLAASKGKKLSLLTVDKDINEGAKIG